MKGSILHRLIDGDPRDPALQEERRALNRLARAAIDKQAFPNLYGAAHVLEAARLFARAHDAARRPSGRPITLPIHYCEDHPTIPPNRTACGWSGYDRVLGWQKLVTTDPRKATCTRCLMALRRAARLSKHA